MPQNLCFKVDCKCWQADLVCFIFQNVFSLNMLYRMLKLIVSQKIFVCARGLILWHNHKKRFLNGVFIKERIGTHTTTINEGIYGPPRITTICNLFSAAAWNKLPTPLSESLNAFWTQEYSSTNNIITIVLVQLHNFYITNGCLHAKPTMLCV